MDTFCVLEEIVGEDPGGRGVRGLIVFGELEHAARDLLSAKASPAFSLLFSRSSIIDCFVSLSSINVFAERCGGYGIPLPRFISPNRNRW